MIVISLQMHCGTGRRMDTDEATSTKDLEILDVRVREVLVLHVVRILDAFLDEGFHLLYSAIEFGFLGGESVEFGVEGVEFRLGVARRASLISLPPNVVLRLLFNESDAFQHIRDIVDSALPHAELICGHIQVEDTATVSLQQSDETFCESAERRIGSRGPLLLARRLPAAYRLWWVSCRRQRHAGVASRQRWRQRLTLMVGAAGHPRRVVNVTRERVLRNR